MKDLLQDTKNIIDFGIRNKIVFSRKDYFEKNEPKDGLFTTIEQLDNEKMLVEKYNLEELKNNSTRINYLENLYTIDLLDKYFPVDFSSCLKVLDIGCKNWACAKGEHYFFKNHCQNLFLDGVEIDPNRLYNNFYSREEVAKFHIKNLKNANYIKDDFLNHKKKYDFVILILPFVFEHPHLKWGLPKKNFKPEQMLLHACNSLIKSKHGGKIFIINQGEEEFEAQKSICDKLRIDYTQLGQINSQFSTYRHSRYALIIS